MVHYFFPLLEGELFYSAIARTMALVAPYSAWDVGGLLYGNNYRGPGVRIPCNGRALLANVPGVAGLSEDRLLRASLFPHMAPFMDNGDREQLREAIMGTRPTAPASRLMLECPSGSALRYCPKCVHGDAKRGTAQHWRTLHQHPGVSCCAEHGCLLVAVKPKEGRIRQLFNAVDCVDTAAQSPPATDREIDLARTLLRVSQSTLSPGPAKLSAALHAALVATGRFRAAERRLRKATLFSEIRSAWGDDVLGRISCPISGDANWVSETLCGHGIPLGHRYAVLARLAGLGLEELIERASGQAEAKLPLSSEESEDVVRAAKERILLAIEEGRAVSRVAVYNHIPLACRTVFRSDPAWYEEHLPVKKPALRRVDWFSIDKECAEKILSAYKWLTRPNQSSRPEYITSVILARQAGVEIDRGRWTRERMPLTTAAMVRCKDADAVLALRRAKWAISHPSVNGGFRGFTDFLGYSGLQTVTRRCARSLRIARAAWNRYIVQTESRSTAD